MLEPSIQKPRKTRARTGCLNCRKKHKKCDETKPNCSSCMKRSEVCEWPINNGRFNRNSISGISGIIVQNNETENLDKYADRLLKNFNEKAVTTNDSAASPIRKYSLFSNHNSNSLSMSSKSSKSVLLVSPPSDHDTSNINTGSNILPPMLNSTDSLQKVPLNQLLNSNRLSPGKGISKNDSGFISHESSLNKRVNGNIENEHKIDSPFDTDNPNRESRAENKPVYFNSDSIQGNGFNNCNNPTDASPEARVDSNTTYSFSPPDSLAPFLLYNDLHNTLRDYMFTNAELNDFTTTANFNNILCSPAPNFLSRNSSKNLQDLLANPIDNSPKELDVRSPANTSNNKVSDILNSFLTELSSSEQLELFKNYLYEVAPWLDMFDNSNQFGTTVADLAQGSKALLYAIYAISSRQKEQTDPEYPSEKTINLYQESLKHLIPTVNRIIDKSIISACVILCVFEMMSSSPREWRHHLEGCHALFEANDINGFSGDLERRLFWCYARMDVNSAVIGEQCTIIPSESWLPKGCSIYELKRLFNDAKDDDMYANYIVFLCSRVLNLITKDSKNFHQEWEFLWNEIIDWNLNRPFHLKPILGYDDKPFPGVLFLNGPAISANQLFHMAVILLTQNKPRLYKIKPSSCIVCINIVSYLIELLTKFTEIYYLARKTNMCNQHT